MERLLTTREVADELGGVSIRYVQNQVAAGRLRAIAYETGARATLRYRREDVALFTAKYLRERDGSADR